MIRSGRRKPASPPVRRLRRAARVFRLAVVPEGSSAGHPCRGERSPKRVESVAKARKSNTWRREAQTPGRPGPLPASCVLRPGMRQPRPRSPMTHFRVPAPASSERVYRSLCSMAVRRIVRPEAVTRCAARWMAERYATGEALPGDCHSLSPTDSARHAPTTPSCPSSTSC